MRWESFRFIVRVENFFPFLEVRFALKIYRLLTRVAVTVKHSLPNQIGNTFFKFVHSFFNYKLALKGGKT